MKAKDETIRVILSTHDDLLQAQQLARSLVEQSAAACVNVVPNVTSVFHWEGAVQIESELLMIIKTTAEKSAEVKGMLETEHSYEVPEIVELEGTVLHQPYLEWILESLG